MEVVLTMFLVLTVLGATVVEVESSHVPMLSKPDVVIEAIRKAAKAIQEKTTT